MNASGRPNTCKSYGIGSFGSRESGGRVRNAYATHPPEAYSRWKRRVMRRAAQGRHLPCAIAYGRRGTGMRPIR